MMEKYTPKSKIKKIKVQKEGEEKNLYAEIIKDPKKSMSQDKQSRFIEEINAFVLKSWGDFGKNL